MRIAGHHDSGTGGLRQSAGSVLSGVWVGTTSVPAGPSDVKQRLHDRLGAARHEAEAASRGVDQHHVARREAERAQVRAQ